MTTLTVNDYFSLVDCYNAVARLVLCEKEIHVHQWRNRQGRKVWRVKHR